MSGDKAEARNQLADVLTDREVLDAVYAKLSPVALFKMRWIVAGAPVLSRDQELLLTRALSGYEESARQVI